MTSQVDVFPFSFLLYDWRLAPPSLPWDKSRSVITGKVASRVPVIRLYGYSKPLSSPKSDAKQCCLNIHGYMPKLFMDVVPGMSLPDIAELIDSKLTGGVSDVSSAAVYNITLTSRVNFYGYSDVAIEVLVVEMFRPVDVARVAELVTTPGTFGPATPPLKVYEVHIPYLLQFLVEHGIQGVTPFYIDSRRITVPVVKSTFCELEISAPFDAVAQMKKDSPSQGTERAYPVPQPLSSSTSDSSTDLVCEVLQSLWQEEFERCIARGEKFPYEPEGIVSGISRPDCTEMPWVAERKGKVASLVTALENQEKVANEKNCMILHVPAHAQGGLELSDPATSSVGTQSVLQGLADLIPGSSFDLSLGHDDSNMGDCSITQVVVRPPPASGEASTFPMTSVQLSATEVQTERQPPSPERNVVMSEPVRTEPTVPSRPVVPQTFLPNGRCVIAYTTAPPRYIVSEQSFPSTNRPSLAGESQPNMSLSGATQIAGPMRVGKPVPVASTQHEHDILTFGTMAVVEMVLDVPTGAVASDPNRDAVLAIAAVLVDERTSTTIEPERVVVFYLAASDCCERPVIESGGSNVHVSYIPCLTEESVITAFISQVLRQFDPAVLLSWDCSKHVVAFLLERMRAVCPHVLSDQCPPGKQTSPFARTVGEDERNISPGRLLIDLWRVLRNDAESGLRLATTTWEGVCHSVLGVTVPSIPDSVLSSWWPTDPARVLQRITRKVVLVAELCEVTRVMPRATEMARLYGMDLESTFTRGSQFRVECMLIRASRRLGYVLPSSSKSQVKGQNATEGIPMVLEPASGLITDPVIVLDFQSLYPSLVIAYNYCYSTCVGRTTDWHKTVQLGTQPNLTRRSDVVRDCISSPADVGFVQRHTRVGLIPRLSHEVLQTRLMVKASMKVLQKRIAAEGGSGNSRGGMEALLKQLDARQLSLKLLANVIYGYTTASFSGRMPCAEIADSIVLTARQSLEAVMRLAESMGGTVVYGDTDSLFVRLPGKSVREAFVWGGELVAAVSTLHPWPMKLILEKVYWPCCLVTKKRYVGRSYLSPESSPVLDAKGIETIRRDTCPAVAVTIERILNCVFSSAAEGQDPQAALEAVCVKEFARILRGALPMKLFVFQNQVRELSQYRDMQHLPPAARVAVDSGRTETSKGERVAYVITNAGVGSRLSEQVRPPSALFGTETLNYDYYVTKQVIPAVQRIFGPLGNPVFAWLSQAKTGKRSSKVHFGPTGGLGGLVTDRVCLVCRNPTASSIFKSSRNLPLFCARCVADRSSVCVAFVFAQLRAAETRASQLRKLCCSCTGGGEESVSKCTDAYHCEIYFQRELVNGEIATAKSRTAHPQILNW